MFKHIITIIWNNRQHNIWLVLGLFVISTCLWYAVDYLYAVKVNQNKTLGFDWHHVYNINVGALTPESHKYRTEKEHTTEAGNDFITFLNRLEHHPDVEAVCFTRHHKHYVYTNSSSSLKLDTLVKSTWVRLVSPDYFQVFRVKGADGSSPEELAAKANFTDIIITQSLAESFFPDGNATGQLIKNLYRNDSVRIAAVCENQKYNEYTSHQPATYMFFNLNDMSKTNVQNIPWFGVYIRVRPDADKENFIRNFRKEMRTQLMVGNLYLEEMRPMSVIREEHLKDDRNLLYTHFAVAVFFLLNVFLAVLGTFWFRTQQRRSELGLRVALGCSKQNLRGLLIGEGLIILTLSFIPAAIVAWNLGYADIVSTYPIEFTAIRFVVGIAITYLLLALTVAIGTWFPARQAMGVEPAEALHEE